MLADVEMGVTMSDSDDGSNAGSQSGFSHWKREPMTPCLNQTELPVVASFGPMTSNIPADFVDGGRGTQASRRPPEFSSLDSLDESSMVATTSMETNTTLNLATASLASGDVVGASQPTSCETTDEE